MKNENPGILWIVISFTWRLLDIFEKCTENENFQIFQIYGFYDFFLFKCMKSTKNPSKFYSLHYMT